jgi:integrase
MLYKREGSPFLWFKFVVNGKSVRGSTETADRTAAREAEARARLEYRQSAKKGITRGHTWDEAALEYLEQMPESDVKRNARYTLRWLQQHLGGRRLEDVDEDLLFNVRAAKIRDINKAKAAAAKRGAPSRWSVAQPTTVNRMFTGLISPILAYAKKRKWITTVPEMPRMEESDRDPVWAPREKAMKLLMNLGRLQTRLAMFGLEVGWRRSNVTHLTWQQVDFERRCSWVSAQAAKEGKGIATPLSEVAVEILLAQWADAAKDESGQPVTPYVFARMHCGAWQPIKQTSTRAFRAARDKAGLPANFTWHSLRHTWATWHRMDRTPLDVLRELGGWRSDRMVERYAHFDASHLQQYVDQRQGLALGVGGGHNGGHTGSAPRLPVQSKSLIDKQSGNSSVGRAQPCQGRIRGASRDESKSYLLEILRKPAQPASKASKTAGGGHNGGHTE